ncbi:hypothetical protein QGN29_14275 [Temperatibacter marinus]|uniref:CBM20 domain-containing protein n=1 Tax=Temperatibacter marinus TaxID=1456591 RepID=A0AA52EDE2_9PROT|nr:hypothetical protein [Temperatibacter marinus]WND02716.1 hypothetical protein QGN29_14275 [Temperatibacter marinus]
MNRLNTMSLTILALCAFLGSLCTITSPIAAEEKEYLTAYIVVTVPEGTPDVFITGNLEFFGPWWADKVIMHKDANRRIYQMEVPKYFRMQYKFTLGDWKHEAIKKNGRKYKNFKMKVTKNNQVFQHTVDDWSGEWKKAQ